MLRIAIIVGIIGGIAILGYVHQAPTTTEYTATTTATSTAPSTAPEYPEEWLKEAEAAKQAVIEKKKTEAELAEVQEQLAELKAREAELEKKLGTY